MHFFKHPRTEVMCCIFSQEELYSHTFLYAISSPEFWFKKKINKKKQMKLPTVQYSHVVRRMGLLFLNDHKVVEKNAKHSLENNLNIS